MQANGNGTVFRLTPGGTLTTLYTFTGAADGGQPTAGLVQAADGDLYGTTLIGGAHDGGTIFKITPAGTLTTQYSFCSQTYCADGSGPSAGLILGIDGNLYGSTAWGGNTNGGGDVGFGTVFQITPTGTLTTLYSFDNASQVDPVANLVQGSDGNLYGATSSGGSVYGGTLFQLTLSGTLTTLYNFGETGGGDRYVGLIQGTGGNFFGITFDGGTHADGTVFSLSVGLGPFVALQTTSGKVGAAVKILGTDLTGATGVTFNGTAATFTIASASEIATKVPSGATAGIVQVVTPGGTLTSNAAYNVDPSTLAPVFSPKAGAYTRVQPVSIKDATPGATIYYTTDGTTPSTSSAVYASPIVVSSAETLKAVALGPDDVLSVVKTAAYTVTIPWVGAWDGTITSTCGYISGPFDVVITSLGGYQLNLTDNYGDNYDLTISASNQNSATSPLDGGIYYTISGTSMTASEPAACQTASLTKQ